MNDFLNASCIPGLSSINCCLEGLDINKILVIVLLLTGNLQIEAITVYPNDFAVTLGTFRIV